MRMPAWIRRLARRLALGAAMLVVALLVLRIWDSQRGPPLSPWHLVVPEELGAKALDAADWPGYLAAEDAAFATVRRKVTEALEPQDQIPANRYFAGSPLHPAHFAQDWNRSFVLEPGGDGREARGAVVLLHGLTDAPFSLRHIGARYRDRGWAVIGLRLPGHGTVPAALTDVTWEDWQAATRLAMREARRRAGPGRPLHIVGFSNGGALAMKYALDAAEDPRPATGGAAGAHIPHGRYHRLRPLRRAWPRCPPISRRFAKTAWLGIVPEFIPFKYNSFPVNGARQSLSAHRRRCRRR